MFISYDFIRHREWSFYSFLTFNCSIFDEGDFALVLRVSLSFAILGYSSIRFRAFPVFQFRHTIRGSLSIRRPKFQGTRTYSFLLFKGNIITSLIFFLDLYLEMMVSNYFILKMYISLPSVYSKVFEFKVLDIAKGW